MSYTIELYFDAETATRVEGLVSAVFANCGGADLLGHGFRPHISLAGYATLIEFRPVRTLARFALRGSDDRLVSEE